MAVGPPDHQVGSGDQSDAVQLVEEFSGSRRTRTVATPVVSDHQRVTGQVAGRIRETRRMEEGFECNLINRLGPGTSTKQEKQADRPRMAPMLHQRRHTGCDGLLFMGGSIVCRCAEANRLQDNPAIWVLDGFGKKIKVPFSCQRVLVGFVDKNSRAGGPVQGEVFLGIGIGYWGVRY